ncbi:transcription termination factor NusA [Candidatus Nomurabacteria bacterium RIFCSPLOWO2_01_FULL_33_24]|uniref:Transcription termination/antitermination protein NusA n=1 Tax=Candidatus Nomurabacteria bacterium RIFCSPLOWO2_01_FULL_33_24 TaxID=1801765 RepID=A0A1F6WZF3_9BACT|nr:MAG: transcription termination factor NusA [Candidatus Nomurabacteria bacterium RIFCSPLOWO2_01_FULL_33_24]
MDLKVMRSALEQLEEERKIPKEKIIEAIEQALAAAYKKDYGKKDQIIRAHFDLDTGKTDFYQVKIVVDESTTRIEEDNDSEEEETGIDEMNEDKKRARYNTERHILLADAKKIKSGIKLDDEITFPLEAKDDYGRIAAQTAKQVIIQRIREAERSSIISEYGEKEEEIVSGIVQKIERGNVFVDFNRVTGILPYNEQIPGEHYRQGQRVRAFLYSVEETPRGINLKLSRTHPRFLEKLFEMEVPEIANNVVEIKSIAREAGSRSKIAVMSNDEQIDPVGSCVGQKGIRVTTVMGELGGEKIDIIEWSEDPAEFVISALSPAKILDINIEEKERKAIIEVAEDQLSLAIGKGGQNVRLAAKLTGWRIDIRGVEGEKVTSSEEELNGEEISKMEEISTSDNENKEIKKKE